LKSLIQVMAASVLKKQVRYYTFGEVEFAARLENVYKLLVDKKVTVGTPPHSTTRTKFTTYICPWLGQLMTGLVSYNRLTPESKAKMDLFTHLIDKYDN